MKFCVLALDYDGTIAENGKPHPAVMEAIQEARALGIVVVLVTGRILSDLKRVAGDLNIFDAVVAENGAVLAFANGRTRVSSAGCAPTETKSTMRIKSLDHPVVLGWKWAGNDRFR